MIFQLHARKGVVGGITKKPFANYMILKGVVGDSMKRRSVNYMVIRGVVGDSTKDDLPTTCC